VTLKHLTFLLFVFTFVNAKAQTEISGIVTDYNKTAIESANTIIQGANNNILAYSYTKNNGSYLVNLKSNKNPYIIITVNSLGFEKAIDTIQIVANQNKYTASFQLQEKTEQLNEVLLLPTEKISREGRVTTLKVNAFTDGTEQTIEDILKDLPGVEVLKDGTIKAHGKYIDKLLIEGEDMFDKKYQILSKNLDAKVLDAVQILDNFEDNPILAKVSSSEKVALNLVLKDKYKNIWFGNISAGLGTKDRIKTTSNIGLIRKKIKFFNFNNYNNLGNKATEQLKDAPSSVSLGSSFQEQQISPSTQAVYTIQNNENSIFEEGQSTFNKALINSLSYVTSLTPKLKVRGTGYYTKDNQQHLFSSETFYNTGTTPIHYSENNNTNHKNSIAGGQLELKYTNGEKSFLKNTLVYKNNPETITNSLLFNNNNTSQNLTKKEYAVFNHLNYSYLIGKKNMLHNYFYVGTNNIVQKADLNSSALNNSFLLPENTFVKHSSDDKVTAYGGISTILVNFKKIKNTFELGYESLKENRKNKFMLPDSEVDSLQNSNVFSQRKIQFKTTSKYSLSKKIAISVGFSLDNVHVNTQQSKNSKWLFNPKIRLYLNKMKIGRIRFGYRRDYTSPKSTLFLENHQLSSHQSFKKGTKNIYFPTNNLFSFNYKLSNEMKTKAISIQTRYRFSDGKYSTENRIGQNIILTSSNFVNSGDLLSSSLNFTSYFKKLKLSTNIGSSQNWTSTPIKANTTQLKNLKTYYASYFLTGTTYFKLPVNFSFKLNLDKSYSIFNTIKSTSKSENATLNITYTLSKTLILNLNNNFYQTKNGSYYFLGGELNYNLKKSKFSYQLKLNNLTNENDFSTVNIDEYSTYTSTIKLLPRYVFALVKYRF